MAINNFLVIGVNPANNEKSVPVNKEIAVTFSKHMDAVSINPSTIVLRQVNGDIVPATVHYEATTLIAKVSPSQPLLPGTQYQVQVLGSPTGIKSITGDYMSAGRTYEFTTTHLVQLTPPNNVKVIVDSGFPLVSWEQPTEYDPALALSYDVQISTSNDPLNPPVWPSVGDVNRVGALTLNVPKKLPEGSYYAYVKAVNASGQSDWSIGQFVVEAAPVATPSPTPTPAPNPGGGDIFSFDVVDKYPSQNSVDMTPDRVVIQFSDNVDPATVTADSVYIVKKADKATLSGMDLMIDYGPDKKIVSVLLPITTPNMVMLTATFEDDAEYTVIVRESVKSTTGASLGMAAHWSFITKYTRLYGDPKLIRQDIGALSNTLTDKALYQYMSESSKYVYEIASNTSIFVASDYENGQAPYYIHQYARYRTAYDLLLNAQLSSTGGSGFTSQIVLGDLTVSKEADAGGGGLSDILADLKEKLKPFMDMIQGHHNRGYAKPMTVVRGENVESYPDFLTRTDFVELGQ